MIRSREHRSSSFDDVVHLSLARRERLLFLFLIPPQWLLWFARIHCSRIGMRCWSNSKIVRMGGSSALCICAGPALSGRSLFHPLAVVVVQMPLFLESVRVLKLVKQIVTFFPHIFNLAYLVLFSGRCFFFLEKDVDESYGHIS